MNMKNLLLGFNALILSLSTSAATWRDSNGVIWSYVISDGVFYVSSGELGVSAISAATEGVVTIPSEINGHVVRILGGSAFEDCTKITGFVFPDTLEVIGESAFNGCTGLAQDPFRIPDSVLNIKNWAFQGTRIRSMVIPANVQSIDEYAFNSCSELCSFEVASENSNFVSIDGALLSKDGIRFLRAPAKEVVRVPDGVRNLDRGSFLGLSAIRTLILPSSISDKSINGFEECTGIEKLTFSLIPSFLNYNNRLKNSFPDSYANFVSVTVLPGPLNYTTALFDGCSSLKEVTLPDNLEILGQAAFADCISLEKVMLPDSLKTIQMNAFSGCKSLREVYIPPMVGIIGSGAFNSCSALKTIKVYYGETDRIRELMRGKGVDVDAIDFIEPEPLSNGTETIDLKSGLAFRIENGEASLTGACGRKYKGEIVIPESVGGRPVRSILDSSCEKCLELESVIIPEGVRNIGNFAFRECFELKKANVPSTATNIGYFAFKDCRSMADFTCACAESVVRHGAFEFRPSSTGTSVSDVTLTVSNVVVHYVTTSVKPDLATPVTPDAGFVNVITEVNGGLIQVSPSWAANYPSFTSMYGSDFAAALSKPTGKRDVAGNELHVWQDFVAGTDPTDKTYIFNASITFVDDKPIVSWVPELKSEQAALRKYTIYGKVRLTDQSWTPVEDNVADFNFFKVSVEMR